MIRLSRLGLGALGLTLALGCTPPDFSLPTTSGSVGQPSAGSAMTRTLALPRGQVFPKVVEVLLDMGYQVRSASADLGLVNLSRTWYDETLSARPALTMEATLLFQADGQESTRLLVLPTGHWSVVSIGGKDSASATVTRAQPALDARAVQPFMDELARRLVAPSPSTR